MKKKKQKNGNGARNESNGYLSKLNGDFDNIFEMYCTPKNFKNWLQTLGWSELQKAMEFTIGTSVGENENIPKKHPFPNHDVSRKTSLSTQLDHDRIVMLEDEFSVLREMVHELPCPPNPIHPRATGHINPNPFKVNDGRNEEAIRKEYQIKRPRLFQWTLQNEQSDVPLEDWNNTRAKSLRENLHPNHHRRRNRNISMLRLNSELLVNDVLKANSYRIIARKFELADGERLSISTSIGQRFADNSILEGTIIKFDCHENINIVSDRCKSYPRISFEYDNSRDASSIMHNTKGSNIHEIVIRILLVSSRGNFGKHLPPLSIFQTGSRFSTKEAKEMPRFLMPWLKTDERWFSLSMYLANCFEVALWFSFLKHINQRTAKDVGAQQQLQPCDNSNAAPDKLSDIAHNVLIQKSVCDTMKHVIADESKSLASSKSFDLRGGLIWNTIDTERFISLNRCRKQFLASDLLWTCRLLDLESTQERWKVMIRRRYCELAKLSIQEVMVQDLLSQWENDTKNNTSDQTQLAKNKPVGCSRVVTRKNNRNRSSDGVNYERKKSSEANKDQHLRKCTKPTTDSNVDSGHKPNLIHTSFESISKSVENDVSSLLSERPEAFHSESGDLGVSESWGIHEHSKQQIQKSNNKTCCERILERSLISSSLIPEDIPVSLGNDGTDMTYDRVDGLDKNDPQQISSREKCAKVDKVHTTSGNSSLSNSLDFDEPDNKESLNGVNADEEIEIVRDESQTGLKANNEQKLESKLLLRSNLVFPLSFIEAASCSTIKKSNLEPHVVRLSDNTNFPSSAFFKTIDPEGDREVGDTESVQTTAKEGLVAGNSKNPVEAWSIGMVAATSSSSHNALEQDIPVTLETGNRIDDKKPVKKMEDVYTSGAGCNIEASKNVSNGMEQEKDAVLEGPKLNPESQSSTASSSSRLLRNSTSSESSLTPPSALALRGSIGKTQNQDILENTVVYDHLNLHQIRSFGSEPTTSTTKFVGNCTPLTTSSSGDLAAVDDKNRLKDQPKKKQIPSPRPLRVLDGAPPRSGLSLIRAERSRDDYDIKSRCASVVRRPVDALSIYRNQSKRITGSRDDQDIGPVLSRPTPPKAPSFKAFSGKGSNQMNNSWSCTKTLHPESSRRTTRNVNPESVFCTRSETALDDRVEYQHWQESCKGSAHEEGDSNTITKDGSTTITSALSPREFEEICILKEERNSYRDMCLTLGAEVAKLKNMLASQLTTTKRFSTEFQPGYRPYPTRNGIFVDPDSFSHHAFHIAPGKAAMSDAGFGGDYESLVSDDEHNTGKHFPGESLRLQASVITMSGSDASLDHTGSQNNVHMPFIGIRPTRDYPDPVSLNGMQSRLTKDIMQFLESINFQLHKLDERKQVAVERMTRIVNTLWPRAQVKLYGSHVTGLSLPSSDVDFVVCLPAVHKNTIAIAAGELEVRNAINESSQKLLARKLKAEAWIDPRSMKLIERTVVPVIKVSTKDTKARTLQLDITFDAPGHHGLEAVDMVLRIMDELPMIRPIIIVLKQFLLDRGLLTAYTGGLSSYCLFLMVARYLQEQPSSWGDCGALLMGFLDFYGNCFDPRTTGISVRHRMYFERPNYAMHRNQTPAPQTLWNAVVNAQQSVSVIGRTNQSLRRNSFNDKGSVDGVREGPIRLSHHQVFPSPSAGYVNHALSNDAAFDQNTMDHGMPYSFDPLFVEDPLSEANNVGRNAFRILQVLRAFSDAHRALVAALEWDMQSAGELQDLNEYPLLKCLLQSEDTVFDL